MKTGGFLAHRRVYNLVIGQESGRDVDNVSLDAALAAVTDFVYTFDLQGRFTYANPALHRLLQKSPGEMAGQDFHDLGYPEPLATTLQNFIQQVIDTGEPIRSETKFESAYGIGFYEYIFVPIKDEAGKVEAVAGTTRDITHRVRAEEERTELLTELEASRERLRMVFEMSPAAVAVLRGPDFRYEFANHAYRSLFTEGEEVAGKTLAEVLPEAYEQGFDNLLRKVMETGVPLRQSEGAFTKRPGGGEPEHTVYVDFVYQPMPEADGTVSGVFAHIVDISEQVLARRAIAKSEEDRRIALESAGMGAWKIALPAMSLTADASFFRIFAGTDRSMTYEETVQAVHPDDRHAVHDAMRAAFRPENPLPYSLEHRVVHQDGLIRWISASGRANFPPGTIHGEPVSLDGTVTDITERVTAEEALRLSEARFGAILETTPDPFTIVEAVRDEAGSIVDFRRTYVNEATGRLTGEDVSDLVGSLVSELRPGIHDSELYRNWVRTIETGEPFTVDVQMTFPSGPAYLQLTGVRFGDGVATSFTDLTQRQLVQQQLEEAVSERTVQLQAAVTEAEGFNYSISHDLRTPLRAICSTSAILLEEMGPHLDPQHRDLLIRQNENADRLGRLIDELLRLSRLARAEVNRRALDITQEARTCFEDLAKQGRTNGCRLDVQEAMKATGDAELVRTILHNLLDNACKFSPSGGTVRVRQHASTYLVSDEGVGFDMKFAPKIFLPFERLVTEEEFEGTGIGLANVERIVKRHGGRVWVESQPGEGTTFFFTLGGEKSSN